MTAAVRVESLDDLARVPANTVLVDAIGLAYQAVTVGENWSSTRGHADTRRVAFVQAGNHVVYGAEQLLGMLPMRIVSDGSPTDAGGSVS